MKTVFDGLVGRTLIADPVVKDETLVFETDAGPFVFGGEGDCCAHCYWSEVETPAGVIGTSVESVAAGGWFDVESDEDSTVEHCFLTVRTQAGAITATLRVSHNGYYGGSPTLISSPDQKGSE